MKTQNIHFGRQEDREQITGTQRGRDSSWGVGFEHVLKGKSDTERLRRGL